MELHEFHILQRKSRAQHHRIAITRAGMSRGCREISAAIATGCKYRFIGAEAMDRAVIHFKRNDTAATAFLVHDEIKREILDEEFCIRP